MTLIAFLIFLVLGVPLLAIFTAVSAAFFVFFIGMLWMALFELVGFDRGAEWIYERLGGKKL